MIYMYSHGGSGNHGCEAIVRSTCAMFDQPLTLFTNHEEQDRQYRIDNVCTVKADVCSELKRGSVQWLASAVETKLTGKYELAVKYMHQDMLQQIHKGDICLSIGGDNYCYAGTDLLAALNKAVRQKGAKTVLWGCSVEPELIKNKDVAKDLSKFDLITVRESISYEALSHVNSNVVLVSDPAFTLKKEELPLPDLWNEGNMIGINASPLILQSSTDSEVVLKAYHRLIDYILEKTDCSIALIPHVVWKNNDDREVLVQFYEKYKDTNRVILLDDCNCMQLKGYISRCRFLIGARTHATIAAYSSCIPTLVLGYSVKSRGIAKDLFGAYEHYVLPVQNLKDNQELVDSFRWIMSNETEIRSHLTEIMPDYIKNGYTAKTMVSRLLEEK